MALAIIVVKAQSFNIIMDLIRNDVRNMAI